ncbi:hypothetical protein RvY_13021 [Ramazzottius varieornatus]|uniref:Uncharacterized protein n=1 Tax=Ramazzottius varieornatus TaxID=947166 RepID=A0A1D1VRU3_RAMVA|nr:hypothetical protein RvY_13021 [Ramazzottius varieornatus]
MSSTNLISNSSTSSLPSSHRHELTHSASTGSLPFLAAGRNLRSKSIELLQLTLKDRVRQRLSSMSSILSSTTFDDITSELQERFLEHVKNGDIAAAGNLLTADCDLVNACDVFGSTPLHLATMADNVDMTNFLIGKHADLNAKDGNGNSALHLAVQAGRTAIVNLLLAQDADTNLQNNKHETPLHLAAALNNVEILAGFIRHGTDVTLANHNGSTPIHIAARNGHTEVLSYLLTKENVGHSPSQLLSLTDKKGETALFHAVRSGCKEAVNLLVESGASVSHQGTDRSTALHLACSNGLKEVVRVLLDKSPPEAIAEALGMIDDQGAMPVHRAVTYDHSHLIHMLVSKGGSLNARDAEERTPLIRAAVHNADASVQELLHMRANPVLVDRDGRNFLHHMVLNGRRYETLVDRLDSQILTKLLNARDDFGCTVIHYAAAAKGGLDGSLVHMGASLTTKDAKARSPLYVAVEHGRYSVTKRLLGTKDVFEVINDADYEGKTPLHVASGHGHAKLVQLLLTNGALIQKDREGRTALHAAVGGDHAEVARLLLDTYTYLLDLTDRAGNTPLHTAAALSASACVTLLLDAGAVLSLNKSNVTPVDVAIAENSQAALVAMMRNSRWEQILYQPSLIFGWPVLGFIRECPAVMQVVLDRCLSKENCHPLSPDYCERYYYKALQPEMYCDEEVLIQPRSVLTPLAVLNEMAMHKRYGLLTHPVSRTFLNLKWTSYGIYLHFSSLLLYVAFLGMLTTLVLTGVETDLKPHLLQISSENVQSIKPEALTNITNATYFGPIKLSPANAEMPLQSRESVLLVIVMVLTTVQLIKKLFQLLCERKDFFFRTLNYFEIICYTTTLFFAIAFFDSEDRYIRWSTQWQVGAVAIFCSWIHLMNHLQRYGKSGIYVGVFFREMKILTKSFAVYFIMVIAFSMAHCVLYPEKIFPDEEYFFRSDHKDDDPADWQNAHMTLQASLLRVSDMLVGDVDAIENYIKPILLKEMPFPDATYFIALACVGVVTIIIQAILMATAVYDLQKVERGATLNILNMQIRFHTDVESLLPKFLLRRCQTKEWTYYPNRQRWQFFTVSPSAGISNKTGNFLVWIFRSGYTF